MDTTEQALQKRSQLKLLALIALFIGPLILTWLYHVVGPDWRPATSVHGQLISPVRPLPNLELLDADNQPVELKSLQKQWLLVQFNPGQCTEACQKLLIDLRQLRLTFGKDQNRVQNIYIGAGDGLEEIMSSEQHQRLVHYFPDESTLQELAEALKVEGELGLFYLTDPMGNLVLSYSADYVLKMVRKDMKRLLEASIIG